ncbi:septum formation family protein [Streptacidiphilus sp. MAP5-3]|uniref:septum formation family protein n=1 Tax=unclassified Streptacidiphilus TaxID=2643834 RepID=UPI003512D26C
MTLTPAPPAAGQPTVPVERPRTSAAAVIALIAGVLALVPVAVVLGIVALFRTQRRGLRGKRLAVVALSFSAAWTALAMIGIIGTAAYVGSQSGPVETFSTGTCFSYSDGVDANSGVDVDACGKPHDGEIVGVYGLGGSFPGASASEVQSALGCVRTAAQVVADPGGFGTAARLNVYFPPSQAAWDSGIRSATCVLSNADGSALTGDARDGSRLTAQQKQVLALTAESVLLRMKLDYLPSAHWQIAAALESRLAAVDRSEAPALQGLAAQSPGGANADGLPSLLAALAEAESTEAGHASANATATTSAAAWQRISNARTATDQAAENAYADLRTGLGLSDPD